MDYSVLCAFPAEAPPEGVTSNFVDPPTLAPVVIAVCTIFMTWALIFTAGRLYANRKRLAWSDYSACLALLFSFGQGGLMLAQLDLARHQWDVPACWFFGDYSKILFSQQMMLIPGLFFSKASIFLLFREIFTLEDWMQVAIRWGMGFNFIVYFTSIPVEAYFNTPGTNEDWQTLMLSGKPNKAIYWGVVQSVLTIILDMFIFILPLPIIAKLGLSFRKRLQVFAVFSTAFMGVIASIVSLAYRAMTLNFEDSTWKLCALLLCTVVEINIAIVMSCVPGFSKFIRVYVSEWAPVKALRSRISSRNNSATDSRGSGSKARPAEDPGARKRYQALNDDWLMESGGTTDTNTTTQSIALTTRPRPDDVEQGVARPPAVHPSGDGPHEAQP